MRMEPGEMALRFHFPFIPSVTSRHVYATNPCHRRKVRGEPSDSSRAASVSIRPKERSPTPAGSAGGVSLHGREADGRRGDESATGVRRKLGGAGVRWLISPFGYRSAWPWPRGREAAAPVSVPHATPHCDRLATQTRWVVFCRC